MALTIKKTYVAIVIALLTMGCMSANNPSNYKLENVEMLKLKADTIASEYLESNPDFFGYTVILQTDKEGQLTTNALPLDATFRYSLTEGLGVDGVGISVKLDSSLNSDVQIGQMTKGKLLLRDNYMALSDAIKLFTKTFHEVVNEISFVTLFHDVSMAEPVYLFHINDGYIIIGAISGDSKFMKK